MWISYGAKYQNITSTVDYTSIISDQDNSEKTLSRLDSINITSTLLNCEAIREC